MQSQGLINRQAYSLWLDDIASNTGSILFGGVDKSKYIEPLVALPVQPDGRNNQIISLSVAWTGLRVSGSGNDADFSPSSPTAIVLDSGSTIMTLPDDIATRILNGVGAAIDQTYGAVVPCSLSNDDLTFTFTFGGPNGASVAVPLAEFVAPIILSDGSGAQFQNGEQACSFGVRAAAGDPIIFGDTFLRSAYVVYDLENQVIGLAQTNFNAKSGSSNNIQALDASGSNIPGASSTATVAAIQTFTGNPRATLATGGTGAPTPTAVSPTFLLSSASGSGTQATSGSSSSGAANPEVRPVTIGMQGLVMFGVLIASFVLGGGVFFL
jgi:hypothetical protein